MKARAAYKQANKSSQLVWLLLRLRRCLGHNDEIYADSASHSKISAAAAESGFWAYSIFSTCKAACSLARPPAS